MANQLDSAFTRQLARVFMKHFDNYRVISKRTNTQLLEGKFNPASGTNVDFKRPHDYVTVRSSTGDVSGSNPSDIIAGKVTGVVQDYFTSFVDYNEADEAVKLDQLDAILAPLARRIAIDLEIDYAEYAMQHAALYAGTIGNGATTWDEVAEAGALMESVGVPMDAPWTYAVNPFTKNGLASNQRSLGAGGAAGGLVKTAHEKAMLSNDFAGFDAVMSATSLASVTTQAGADRVGAIDANPDVTYVSHKDTWIQSVAVTGFQATLAIKAGERVTIAGRYLMNQATRTPIFDEAGAKVLWSAVVAADVTLDGSGEGTLSLIGPAIYEAAGAYNTVDSAPVAGDVVTLLGSASTQYQPNLFMHRDAFGLGFVPIKKLYSTDTLATTEDGIRLRVSKYADGDANKQTVRFDLRPAFADINPFFAGHGWGSA